MTGTQPDGAPRQMFSDARRPQRFLRVSSHPSEHLVTLSMWSGEECLATFRLPTAEVPELVAVLVQGLAAGDALSDEILPRTGALGLEATPAPSTATARGTAPATTSRTDPEVLPGPAAPTPSTSRQTALRALDLLVARAADLLRARLDRLDSNRHDER